MSKQNLSDEQIVELGKKIWTIIEARLGTEHGWDFQETVHDVQMYMYVHKSLYNAPTARSLSAPASKPHFRPFRR
jgi:hypothetical protein